MFPELSFKLTTHGSRLPTAQFFSACKRAVTTVLEAWPSFVLHSVFGGKDVFFLAPPELFPNGSLQRAFASPGLPANREGGYFALPYCQIVGKVHLNAV